MVPKARMAEGLQTWHATLPGSDEYVKQCFCCFADCECEQELYVLVRSKRPSALVKTPLTESILFLKPNGKAERMLDV